MEIESKNSLLMAHYTKNWQVAGFFPQYSANFS
jgi:hypothetical protein